MKTLPVNPGAFRVKGFGEWRPAGELHFRGRNPAEIDFTVPKPVLAARLFVGFNVCDKPTWSMNDLVEVVREVRGAQGAPPNSTFVYGRGTFQSSRPECGLVDEESAQVIVFRERETPEAFKKNMIDLAGEVARRFRQESVIVELQKNGVTQDTHFVRWAA